MRILKDEESKLVFEKLAKSVGENLMQLVNNKENPHVFRLHKDRVFYVSARVCKLAGSIPRKSLISMGTCVGKFSKTKQFKVRITFVQWLARYAVHKVWLKPVGEQTFIYGNHVIKRHIGRMTENAPQSSTAVIFSMNDVPLGFGSLARSTADLRTADTEAIAIFHQADVGEYLREEADLI